MANQPFDDKHESDFREWKTEINGNDASDSGPMLVPARFEHASDGRVILVPDDGSRMLDQYGLPILSDEKELSQEEQRKHRWYSALLDAPYAAPERVGTRAPWAVFMNYRADRLKDGHCYVIEGYDEYIQRWESVGIGSDLYLLIHASKRREIEDIRRLRTSDLAMQALEARLDYLHLGPEDGGLRGRSLVPEHWKDLPYLLTRLRPCLAIRRIIDAGL